MISKTKILIINEELFKKIEEYLSKQWINNDFTYPKLSNFIKCALKSYGDGEIKLVKGNLLEGNRVRFNIRLGEEEIKLYENLPAGRRGVIVDKILESYFEKVRS